MGRIRALCFSLWLRAERPLRAQRQVGDGFRWGKRAYGMAWPQFALAAVKDDDLLAEGHDEPVCFALDAGNLTRARRRPRCGMRIQWSTACLTQAGMD
jgi:hypothetical protein